MLNTAFRHLIQYRGFHATARQNIRTGDALPSVQVARSSPGDVVNVRDLFGASKKAILFGVPGAFTPGCSKTHLPGYLDSADKLKQQGVDLIACVSVNDAFVMNAWKEAHGNKDSVVFLADAKGDLARAMDLSFDASGALGNHRFQRFAAIVENGVVKQLFVEPDRTGLDVSLVKNVEKYL